MRLTTAAGVNAVSISEFVIARLLQMWKRLPEIDALKPQRRWEATYGREIAGLTLGVVGPGRDRSPGGAPGPGAGAFGDRAAALGQAG